jgi:DNA-3-methyladenine glycosylase I
VPTKTKSPRRCDWAMSDPLLSNYHDEEWGVPVHEDRRWYEKIVLDGAQAGLSWLIILRKREGYRAAFHDFDVTRVARYTARDVERLMKNPDIVRNRLKVESAIKNARGFLAIQSEYGSFDKYIWDFVEGATLHNEFKLQIDVPAKSTVSDALSKDLRKRGFSFVGSTIVYAFMQASGLVNDHLVSCYRHAELKPRKEKRRR